MRYDATESRLTDKALIALSELYSRGRRIRIELPSGGFLRIDRQLPFLVLHRRPCEPSDDPVEKLICGEASYLISSQAVSFRRGLSSLLQRFAAEASSAFGAAFIAEVWSSNESSRIDDEPPDSVQPHFKILAHRVTDEASQRAIEALEASLRRIKIQGRKATVQVAYLARVHPPTLAQALPRTQLFDGQVCFVGIEVYPIFHNSDTGEDFPMLFRRLHRGFSRALRQAFFVFSRLKTTTQPRHFHVLGPRSLTQRIWDTDRQLARIAGEFDFLLNLTPINISQGWESFTRAKFMKPPVFQYRPIPVDPPILKRMLYSINLDRVEDPTLSLLFRDQRDEIDRQLTMLADRNTRRFLYGSIQLYGKVDDKLISTAKTILDAVQFRSRSEDSRGLVTAKMFAERAKRELGILRQSHPEINSEVRITDRVSGMIVSRGNLLVGATFRCPISRVEALIQHEVGTHILTYWNGLDQKFHLLSCGLAGYDELQEGLAVLAEYLVGGLNYARLRLLAGRVMAAHFIEDGATFVETFFKLYRGYGFRQRTAYIITSRVFRSGGLTKDAVYLRGLLNVLGHFSKSRDIATLYVGKIARQHIPIIEELHHRQGVSRPKLMPRFLQYPATQSRLQRLSLGMEPLDLLNKKLTKNTNTAK